MEKLYCSACNKAEQVKIINKEEEYDVRGDRFSIHAKVYVCTKCNEEIFDEELEKKNLDILYAKYRKKHDLLIPVVIKEIREKYGLSQRAMSRLLDWGEVTYCRYENGSVQDAVHNEVLELIKNPKNMSLIFEKNKHMLTQKEREKLIKKLDQLISKENEKISFAYLLEPYLMSDKTMNEYSGFRTLDLQKMKDLILYIAQESKGILKTKINKLLFYIDFLYFKNFSVSITGSKYVHLKYGPIPNDYDNIINLMIHEGLLEKDEVVFSQRKGIVGEELISKTSIDKNTFDDDELKVIDFCIKKFKKLNCVQISRYSHEEMPYKQTEEKQFISYMLAKDLSLELK